jgi:carbon storage regulator
MLVLSRKVGEEIVINDDIVITVESIHGDKVRLGVRADRSIPIHRGEVWARIQEDRDRFGGPPPPVH